MLVKRNPYFKKYVEPEIDLKYICNVIISSQINLFLELASHVLD